MKTDQAKQRICGFFLAFFLAAGMTLALPALKSSMSKGFAGRDYMDGSASHAVENAFTSAYLLSEPAKTLWGRAEYMIFGQGRAGVVVGAGGILFTAEEFTDPDARKAVFNDHAAFIKKTAETFAAEDIELVLAFIPAKALIMMGGAYPPENAVLNETIRHALQDTDAQLLDLSWPLLEQHSFLKYDTHWSPQGAKRAAEYIAANIRIPLKHTAFKTKTTKMASHQGDLTRYLPGVTLFEELQINETTALDQKTDEAALFDDKDFEVVLVGTSYSANPLWHFEGHLKTALQADVLNVSDQGLGPFAVMRHWMDSENYKTHKPKVVIWEIPERYMILDEAP